jgi:hypothetical protein
MQAVRPGTASSLGRPGTATSARPGTGTSSSALRPDTGSSSQRCGSRPSSAASSASSASQDPRLAVQSMQQKLNIYGIDEIKEGLQLLLREENEALLDDVQYLQSLLEEETNLQVGAPTDPGVFTFVWMCAVFALPSPLKPHVLGPGAQASASQPAPSLQELKEYSSKLKQVVAEEEQRIEHELRVSAMFSAADDEPSKAGRLRGMVAASREVGARRGCGEGWGRARLKASEGGGVCSSRRLMIGSSCVLCRAHRRAAAASGSGGPPLGRKTGPLWGRRQRRRWPRSGGRRIPPTSSSLQSPRPSRPRSAPREPRHGPPLRPCSRRCRSRSSAAGHWSHGRGPAARMVPLSRALLPPRPRPRERQQGVGGLPWWA